MIKENPFAITNQGPQYLSGKLIGGYLPHSMYNYMRLLAVYSNGSVQSVLKEMIETWMNEKEPEESIIETLADRAYLEWVRRGLEHNQDPAVWWEYREEIEKGLKHRKVYDDTILQIINELRSRIGKNKE